MACSAISTCRSYPEARTKRFRHRILGQFVGGVDAHPHRREKCLRVEGLSQNRPDLDTRDPHVATVAQRADPLELGCHLIALHRPDLARRVGEEQEHRGDDKHDRTHYRLDHVPGHRSCNRLIRVSTVRNPRWRGLYGRRAG